MEKPNVALGDLARDTVTGFTGIVVCRTEWLNGCWRTTLQPRGVTADGKTYPSETFDEFQLEVVEPRRFALGSKETGGPRPEPQRPVAPR